jgi:hypothetical protein
MSSNDERLRLAYGAALENRGRAGHGSHLEPEALVALAERKGSEAVRLEMLDHVMACGTCRRELDLVRASLTAAGMPRRRTWFRSPSIGLMAIAAMLLLIAGVRLFVPSSLADIESGPVLRGGSAVAPYPARWIPLVGAGLAWRPTVGAESYRLEVVDHNGAAVIDSTMRDTTFLVADSLLRNRRELTWSVSATLGDGTTVTSHPLRLVAPAR